MKDFFPRATLTVLVFAVALTSVSSHATTKQHAQINLNSDSLVQLGPRPYFLVNDMDDGELKNELARLLERLQFVISFGIWPSPIKFPFG